jgi:hypothetical protein
MNRQYLKDKVTRHLMEEGVPTSKALEHAEKFVQEIEDETGEELS